jgi:hypothetical protein
MGESIFPFPTKEKDNSFNDRTQASLNDSDGKDLNDKPRLAGTLLSGERATPSRENRSSRASHRPFRSPQNLPLPQKKCSAGRKPQKIEAGAAEYTLKDIRD